MKLFYNFVIAFALFGASSVTAVTTINCRFFMSVNEYTCTFPILTIPDNENLNITIGGLHQQGLGNDNVTRVEFLVANVPFIVTQIFTTFPNVNFFTIQNSGLTRIQSNAFTNARNLRTILIILNSQLRTIHENAFIGAPNLLDLNLRGNQIETIHESAFTGLSQVHTLRLHENRIHRLPVNVFSPFVGLGTFSLQDNSLESIDDRLFTNVQRLFQIDISRNQINAIGRNFLEVLPNLSVLSAWENRCVSGAWTIIDRENVRRALNDCFNNFPSVPDDNDVRRFVLELRGPLFLKFENGTGIVRV